MRKEEKRQQRQGEGKIREFDPQIYPCRLWVAKTKDVDMDMLDSVFCATDKDDIHVHYPFKDYGSLPSRSKFATTYPVWHRESGWYGCLVVVNTAKKIRAGVVAHEALHLTHWLFDLLGIGCRTFADDEPCAYMVQWATDRICEVLTGRKNI